MITGKILCQYSSFTEEKYCLAFLLYFKVFLRQNEEKANALFLSEFHIMLTKYKCGNNILPRVT